MKQAAVSSVRIDQESVDTYKRDGVVRLRGLFQPWVQRLQDATSRVIAAPKSTVHTYAKAGEARFFFSMNMWTYDPDFRAFLYDSGAAKVVGILMESDNTYLFKDQLFVKEPGSTMPTPWHHDLPYWCMDGAQVCSLWLALDYVDESNGMVEYVRGSHLWNKLYQPEDFSGEGGSRNPALEKVPDINAMRDNYDIASFELEAGDCVVFHARTLHGAPGNVSTRPRRGLSTRWLGDDAVYTPSRPGSSQAMRDPGLKDGDRVAMGSDIFPKIWSRD